MDAVVATHQLVCHLRTYFTFDMQAYPYRPKTPGVQEPLQHERTCDKRCENCVYQAGVVHFSRPGSVQPVHRSIHACSRQCQTWS